MRQEVEDAQTCRIAVCLQMKETFLLRAYAMRLKPLMWNGVMEFGLFPRFEGKNSPMLPFSLSDILNTIFIQIL